jgi:MFS family permease
MDSQSSEWRRGWPVVLGSAIGLGTAANLHFYVSTFFVKGITEEFGWSRSELASIQAVAMWAVIAAPFIGYMIDRLGTRLVLTAGMGLLGLIYVAAAHMPAQFWAPLLLFALIQSVGQATATVPHTRVISSWFSRNRGFALGLTITGIPIVSALVAPFLSAVIEADGWRTGYYVLAGLTLFVGLPVNLLLVRERRATAAPAAEASSTPDTPGIELGAALRSKPFGLLVAAMILVNIPAGGLLNQLVPLLSDGGMTAPRAAIMVSVFASAVIFGRLASGFLLDRMQPALVAAAFTLVPVVGMIGLAFAPYQLELVIGFAVFLIGVQQGAELDLLAYFVARHFGLRRYSSIYGITYAVSAIASSFGIMAFALSHDLSGTYEIALYGSAITLAIAALCFAALRTVPIFTLDAAASVTAQRSD